MNCALLSWAASQHDLQPHLLGILIRLVRLMDDDGRINLAQSAIAPHVRLGERQTRQAIKDLVLNGTLKRVRQGSVGRGRAPDLLMANFEHNADNGDVSPVSVEKHDTGKAPPLPPLSAEKRHKNDTGDTSPVSEQQPDKSDSAASLPVSEIEDAEFVDNAQVACIGTRAHAETLNLNTSGSEIHPETPERECVEFKLAAPDEPKRKRKVGMRADWRPHPDTVKLATQLGIINGWHEATLSNFIDYWISVGKPMADWNATYRNELRKEAQARRHLPRNYQLEARNEHASRTTRTPDGMDVRTGPVSPGTALLMRKIAGGKRDDERRVEPHAGK